MFGQLNARCASDALLQKQVDFLCQIAHEEPGTSFVKLMAVTTEDSLVKMKYYLSGYLGIGMKKRRVEDEQVGEEEVEST